MARYKICALSQLQREALLRGASILIDELFDDYAQVAEGAKVKDCTALAEYLPPQFRHRYGELFVKSFIVCVVRVADRLATWEGGEIPASTAESLALRAIIEKAKEWLTIKSEEEDRNYNVGFGGFINEAFPDLDIELLFKPVWDGIEDTAAAEAMDMSLKPAQWFDPVYAPVHPYLYL